MSIGTVTAWGIAMAGGGGNPLPWPGAWSPVTLTNSSGGAITYGQICYLIGSDAVGLAQSDGTLAEARVAVMSINTASIANAGTGRFVFGGRIIALSGGVAGDDAWLGVTAGALATTPDTASGHYLARAGYWLSTTEFQFIPAIPNLM